jgi:hypothetical protein
MTGNDLGRTSLSHTYPSTRNRVIESKIIVFLVPGRLYLEDAAILSDHSIQIEGGSAPA